MFFSCNNQVLYPIDDTLTETELNITLHEAKFFHSPEEAGLDRAQMKPETGGLWKWDGKNGNCRYIWGSFR